MRFWLAIARAIDTLNEWIGQKTKWLVLLATLISAGNAIMRYGLERGSNAGLELQWYLFGAIFLLGAAYTLKHRGHVRIDLIHAHLPAAAQYWVEILGNILFLLPFSILMIYLSWPEFMLAWQSGETSPDAGGLLRWPVKLLIPAGFFLLVLQGIAEIIKNSAYLTGHLTDDTHDDIHDDILDDTSHD